MKHITQVFALMTWNMINPWENNCLILVNAVLKIFITGASAFNIQNLSKYSPIMKKPLNLMKLLMFYSSSMKNFSSSQIKNIFCKQVLIINKIILFVV
jgi:hypothetical protein